MKILVTGGAGFIGTNFILYWHRHHPQDLIINLDKLTYAGDKNNLKKLVKSSSYRFVQGDIADQALVDKLMAEVDIVVNFSA